MKILGKLWERITKWLNIVPTKVRPWDGELLVGPLKDLGPENSYCIEILNDDFTPMEFVVVVLMTCCRMDKERAVELMLEVHARGKAQIGFGSADAMKSLAAHICEEARMYGHPLVVLSVETTTR
jgi:ATP-dependent Clp protease adapter protein ClpS